ncbi:MAG: hypothetical protein NZ108_04625 [Bacteroidia bacterium]|nr:hypothetical protein [Bacteroidia bacterium]
MKSLLFSMLTVLLTAPAVSVAQCDKLAENCSSELFPYQSDGQYYRTQIVAGEEAQLKIMLYKGLYYRIVPCSGADNKEKLHFKIIDKQGNIVFSNEKQPEVTYWDFSFGASGEYKIVAKYPTGSGCAAFLIGYDADKWEDE